ncbi:DinB family protein [Catelliglobosispora koreensis]|uniref:DinB family protein n=1 Tax=Catelliglobosispora koreensis TaxID=129052 RepID=UPI00035F95CA|nr:DinB family protein [Catelliglobosispora koreensis]
MELSEVTLLLAKTPATAEGLLAGLPGHWVHYNDGPGTWSAYDIVGHLAHGDAANWIPRAKMILAHGTGRSFEPFDREAMLKQERQPLEAVLALFRKAREASLAELASLNLSAQDLEQRGSHPEFGEVALRQMIAAWVAHDLTHLAQIGEVLARRYRQDVGPWRKYMPALDRVAEAE